MLAGGRGGQRNNVSGGLGHAPAWLPGTFAELSQPAKQSEREKKLLHPQKEHAEPGNCPRDKGTAAQRSERPRELAKHARVPCNEHGVFSHQIRRCRGTVAPPLLCDRDNLGFVSWGCRKPHLLKGGFLVLLFQLATIRAVFHLPETHDFNFPNKLLIY